jgi:hemoglobin/transferrin/lactoferrin receptor protein
MAQADSASSDTARYKLTPAFITAYRYEKPAFETYIPVDMLESMEIRERNPQDLADLAPLLNVQVTGSGPWSERWSMRGLSGPHVLVLVDGLRLDVLRAFGDHAPLVDPDRIERVEVVRGPASVLYGSDAVAGVVNLITHKTDPRTGGRFGIGFQSGNMGLDQSAEITARLGRHSLRIGIVNRSADDVMTPMGRLANTGYLGRSAFVDAGFALSPGRTLDVSVEADRTNKSGVPVDPYAKDAAFRHYDRDRIALAHRIAMGQGWIVAEAYAQRETRRFHAFIDQKPRGGNFLSQSLDADRAVQAYGGSIRQGFQFHSVWTVQWGLDGFFQADRTSRTADAFVSNGQKVVKDPPPDLSPPLPKSRQGGLALFAESEWTPLPRWTWTTGLRYDAIFTHADGTPGTLIEKNDDRTDKSASGSFGLLFRLSPDVHLSANLGSAFKAPSLQERYFRGTGQTGFLIGNPSLEPEQSLNVDLGFQIKTDGRSTRVSAFVNRIDRMIILRPTTAVQDTFQYESVGKARLWGTEVSSDWSMGRIVGLFRLSWTSSRDETSGGPLPMIPPLSGSAGIRAGEPGGAAWMECRIQGQLSRRDPPKPELPTAGYAIVNLYSGLRLGRIVPNVPVRLTFDVRNLFNVSYRDPLSGVTWWDAPGLSFSIGFSGEWIP